MVAFFKYIVLFFLCFNISAVNAAKIILDLDEEEHPRYISAEFKGALNLPHPAIFKQMLNSPNNSKSGQLLFIGIYFDAKYPGDAIEYDFGEDVKIIFPDLDSREVVDRTNFIRNVVKTYRWGKEKYTELAKEVVTPKDPPLLVDDNEYALLGTVDYIPVPEGSFAVVDEFKKVVSYSSNPRDVEAMEAYQLRQLEKKENKTNYEKLQSMVSKLEFTKIPYYGIDYPNPLVGTAGSGKWVEKDGFKARLIAELAQIKKSDKFIAGVHINIPNHRFMLGNSLSESLKKPQIELINTYNVKNYKVFYPITLPVANEKMINAYTADIVFPLEIETINPEDEVLFSAKIVFEDCNGDIDCQKQELISDIHIEKGPDNLSSAIKNYAKQYYYNIPKEENAYISLDKIYANVKEDKKTVESINMVFSFSATIKNFNLLIEDNKFTQFSKPVISINDDKIYVSVKPLTNQDALLSEKIEITTKLNNFAFMRKTVDLSTYLTEAKQIDTFLHLILIALWAGILFNLTPIGISFLCSGLISFNNQKDNVKNVYCATMIFTTIFFLLSAYGIIWYYYPNILLSIPYTNMFYLNLCIYLAFALYLSTKYTQPLMLNHYKLKAVLLSFGICLFTAISHTPYLAEVLNQINFKNIYPNIAIVCVFAIGIMVPYILLLLWQHIFKPINFSDKTIKNLTKLGGLGAIITWLYLIGLVFLQITFISFLKIMLLLLIIVMLYNFFYNFVVALYQTSLSSIKKHISENIVLIIAAFLTLIISFKAENYALLKNRQTTALVTEEQIDTLVNNGKIVIVGITADWSYLSNLNKLITLNDFTIKRLKKIYNLEYFEVNASNMTPEIKDYILRYKNNSAPMYVLYTFNANKGIVLPTLLKSTDLEQIIQNFKI